MSGDWVTKQHASDIMMASDFIAVRRDDRPLVVSPASMMSGLAPIRGDSPRRRIIERKFREKMLQEFEQYDPSAVDGEKYFLPSVLEWLDKLLDAEVAEEIGIIPTVKR